MTDESLNDQPCDRDAPERVSLQGSVPQTTGLNEKDNDINSRSTVCDGREGIEFAIEAYGARIGIWLQEAELLDDMWKRFPPGARIIHLKHPGDLDRFYRVQWLSQTESLSKQAGYHIFINEHFSIFAPSRHTMSERLESSIQMDIAELARPFLFVHAGVVGWNGRAIVLPGSSFAGKSTLVAALVNAGAVYFSDEYAVLDSSGRVHPYARELSLREGPMGPDGRMDLGDRAPRDDGNDQSLEIGLVALLQYEVDGHFKVERLSPTQGILAMCKHVVAIQHRPKETFDVLGKIMSSAEVVEGTRGEVEESIECLIETVRY